MEPSLHVFFAKSFSERGQRRLMKSALDLLQNNQTITFTAYDSEEPPFELMMAAGDHMIVIPPADGLTYYSSNLLNLASITSDEDYSQLVSDCPAHQMLRQLNFHGIYFKDCETFPPVIECTPGILGGPTITPPTPTSPPTITPIIT